MGVKAPGCPNDYGALGNNCAQKQLRSETPYHKNTTGQLTKQVTIDFETGSAGAIVFECTVVIGLSLFRLNGKRTNVKFRISDPEHGPVPQGLL